MRDIIVSQPEQITHSLEVNANVRVVGTFDEIILAGMGGSGHPGDLLSALELTTIPLTVHRHYGLPRVFGKKPLIIISTYSGNTEESLSAYTAAHKSGYSLLANTAGGKLAEWSKRDNVPLTRIDFPGMQPRHTLFASFTGLYAALRNSNLAKNIDNDLQRVANSLAAAISTLEHAAKKLASELNGKIPVFTASPALAFAAKNFKIQMNENAKMPAFWNEFPELNHNEMVGFSAASHPDYFHVVMLRDDSDHPRVKARMDVTSELYKQWGIGVTDFTVRGKTQLEKIFYAVCFGLWVTYYVATNAGIDPIPVVGVENFKKKLAEVAGEL